MWRVYVHRGVRKFEKRHPEYKHVVARAIESLSRDPYQGERLAGRCRGLWKLRLGRLRVIYRVDPARREVFVLRAGLRENVYEGLC